MAMRYHWPVRLSNVARLLGNGEAMVEKVYGKHAPDYLGQAVNALMRQKVGGLLDTILYFFFADLFFPSR